MSAMYANPAQPSASSLDCFTFCDMWTPFLGDGVGVLSAWCVVTSRSSTFVFLDAKKESDAHEVWEKVKQSQVSSISSRES